MKSPNSFREEPFPKHREMLTTISRLNPQHYMHGLLEMDVTKAREFIQTHKEATGESLSFTGWLIKCIAQAISEFKHLQAYRKGKRLIIFDDVDVGFTMEREVGGERVVAGYIIRKANEKKFREIHDEIRSAQNEVVKGALVGTGEDVRRISRIQSLPGPLRRLMVWWFKRNIFLRKQTQGTVGLTSVGMFGEFRGWPLVLGPFPVFLGIGGVDVRPGYVGDCIERREFLRMSMMFDHDAADGADAARFASRLGQLMQDGFGLEE
ncbi:MAG: 2-oxo acid dehydrogenase subunit E2 [Candidatus Thorarchaeota archaeon]|jgi:pyruvate/2-oxoglutarate dehydrogenase complex dihydrolipoamide acyltransferase (E2) component